MSSAIRSLRTFPDHLEEISTIAEFGNVTEISDISESGDTASSRQSLPSSRADLLQRSMSNLRQQYYKYNGTERCLSTY